MTKKMDETRALLEKHHRDGPAFAQLMEDSYASRYNDDFWALWREYIATTLSEGSVVVDLGTGPATFPKNLAMKYPGLKIYGVEAADYMIDAIGDLPSNVEIIVADLHEPQLSFEEKSVDVVVASVVVHEMHQPIAMMREVRRILKSGGYFYIYDWVRVPLQQYLAYTESDPFDESVSIDSLEDLFIHFVEHNRFSVEDLKFMLEGMHFDIVKSGEKNQGQHAWMLARAIG